MFEQFIPANQALVDGVQNNTYGRLEQLTLWNLTAPLWPGASLGLKVLPLGAMHSDMDIVTRTLGMPTDLQVTTVARDADSASIEATLTFDGAFVMRWDGQTLGIAMTDAGTCDQPRIDFRVRRAGGRLAVSARCRFPGSQPRATATGRRAPLVD